MLDIQNEMSQANAIFEQQIIKGDIYSSDPYIRQQGITNALNEIYKPFA
jgi:hypothetical protein